MKSYLLSWLAKKHAASTLEEFARDLAGDWLVWEAGPWRPPAARRETLVATPGTRLLSAGESLAIALVPPRGAAEVRLGRAPDNELVIDDATLSRLHLVFARDAGGRWTVRDAGSSNGSKVDGAKLAGAAAPLATGYRIEAGAVRLTFYDAAGLYLRVRGAA